MGSLGRLGSNYGLDSQPYHMEASPSNLFEASTLSLFFFFGPLDLSHGLYRQPLDFNLF